MEKAIYNLGILMIFLSKASFLAIPILNSRSCLIFLVHFANVNKIIDEKNTVRLIIIAGELFSFKLGIK